MREQNALPRRVSITKYTTAKDAIDNGGAGRAAKSANPFLCANKKEHPRGVLFCSMKHLHITNIYAIIKITNENLLHTSLSQKGDKNEINIYYR